MAKANDVAAIKRMMRAIARARIKATDMRNFGGIVVAEKKAQFNRSESADGSEKWEPLSPKTIKRKSGQHSTTRYKQGTTRKTKAKNSSATPTKPLIDSGQMRDMYVSEATADRVVVSMAKSRSTGVSSRGESIAEIHHDGRGNNPARPHIGIPKAAITRIQKAFADHVERTWKSIINARS